MVLNSRTENIRGSDLTGSSGASNRTYTTANANAQDANFSLIVNGTATQADGWIGSSCVVNQKS